jgi:sialate O-acetylesterase
VNFPSPYDLTAYDALLFQAKGKGKFSIGFAQPSITDWDYYSSEAFQADPEWKDYRVPLASVKQGGWGQPKPFTPGAVSGSRVNILAPYMPEGPALMYNALIAPVAGTRIRGVLWYQGETNAGRAAQYRKLLPALIESWRGAFQDPELPFYAVQLAGFMARRDEPGDSEWAELREAQAGVLEVKGTGLATAIDLGAADDIHPKEKKEVAGRLYRWAWRDLYGGTLDPSGPTFRSMEVKGSRAVLTFDHATGGLLAKGGKLKGFAVAGKDKRFVWAKAKIKGNTVTVEENGVEEPVAVRYGWADNPECNLYNKEGLPALPFRTDDWPGLTDNRN